MHPTACLFQRLFRSDRSPRFVSSDGSSTAPPGKLSPLLRAGAILLLPGLLGARVEGGSLTTSFDPDQGIAGALYGSAVLDPTGGIGDSAVLKLNQANGQSGFVVFEDLDAGQPVGSFTATFKLRMGNDTGSPPQGDGFSFNFGPDIPDGTFAFPEEGAGSGLRISFDTFNNAGPANEAPAIDVTFNNQVIASKHVAYLPTKTQFVDVRIQVNPDGTLDLTYAGNVVFSRLLCYQPTYGRFALAANAAVQRFVGDPIDMHWVDDLSIQTTLSGNTAITSAGPRGNGVRPDAVVAISLQDITTAVNKDSVVLKFDGVAVTPSVTKGGGVTTITYDPPGLLGAGSAHRVDLSYSDGANPANATAVSYDFTTYNYVTLPPGDAIAGANVDTSAPGFNVRPHQVAIDRGTSVERAELQLAGKLLNPADGTVLDNIADLSFANADGTFDFDAFIDFSSTGNPTGFFFDDVAFPGLGGASEKYAMEILTYLDLAPGAYTFGVDAVRNYNTTADGSYRESGFRLTAGANPRDLFAREVAVFDKSRPEGAAEFSFVVEQPGIYPFRLLWFSGIGPSSLEWYRVTADGTRVHLADVANGGVPAYRQAIVTPPYLQYITNPRPGEKSVSANTTIDATLVDGTATVTVGSVELKLNGTAVTPSIAHDAGTSLTQISYDPPGSLPSGSTNKVSLAFTDSAGKRSTSEWSFVVEGSVNDPGLLVIEAEHFDNKVSIDANGHSWEFSADTAGYSGDGAMLATPNSNLNVNIDTSVSPRMDYNVEFTVPGAYYVWVRALADSAPGPGQNDSVNVGIDGVLPASSDRIGFFPQGAGYVWSNTTLDGSTRAVFIVTTPGRHVVNVWMREDGFLLDKLLLSNNPNYQPAGIGPAEPPALVVVEAEHYDNKVAIDSNGHSWELSTDNAGYSGDGAMIATPNSNLNVNIDTSVSPRMDYNIEIIKPGTYYVWVRGLADSAPGPGQNDSVNVGIDGVLPATSDRIGFFPQGAGYVWSSTTLDGGARPTFVVDSPGVHTLNVWMREDGYIIDKVLLSSDPNYTPVGAGPAERPAVLVVEAEQYDNKVAIDSNGHSWEPSTDNPGYSGDGAMVATPNSNLNINIDTTVSPRMDYTIEFVKTGSYYVWVRGLADSAPGPGQNDSVNVGIDGTLPATSDRIGFFPLGAGYVWSGTTLDGGSRAVFQVSNPGDHTVNVWMREDGYIIDKVLLTTDPNYIPTALGPPASPRSISVRPRLKIAQSDSGYTLSWTGGGALQWADEASGPYTDLPDGGTSPVTIFTDQARRFYRVAR